MCLWDCESARHQQRWPRAVLSTWPTEDLVRPQDRNSTLKAGHQQSQHVGGGWWAVSGVRPPLTSTAREDLSTESHAKSRRKGQSPWKAKSKGSRSLPDKSQDGLGRMWKGWISEAGKISLVHTEKMGFTTGNATYIHLRITLWKRKI